MQPQRTVYVIDDHEELNEVVEEILTEAKYRVRTFCNARPALEAILAGARPDLVLLDWRLPGMNGEQFLAELDERDVGLTILLFTAVPKQVPLTVQARVAGTLAKPCSLNQLLDAVERATGRSVIRSFRFDARAARSAPREAAVKRVATEHATRPAKLRLVV